jgi:V/A-type H+-transporting ATPase subunit E
LALADILDAIRAEAEADISAIREKAEKEAAALLSRAGEQARAEEERLSHVRDEAADRQTDRIVNRARLDADRAFRAEVEELYLQARRVVADELRFLRGTPQYEDILSRFLEECCAALPDATALLVDPADEDLARRIVAGGEQYDLRVEPTLDSSGGVELTDDHGRAVRDTFETRLARAEGVLRLGFADQVIRGSSS